MEEHQDKKIRYSLNTSKETAISFGTFSQTNGVSPAVVFSALVTMLVYRYTGESGASIRVKTGANPEFEEYAIDLDKSSTLHDLLNQIGMKMNNGSLAKEDSYPVGRDDIIEFAFPLHLLQLIKQNHEAEIISVGQSGLTLSCERNASGLRFAFCYEKSLYMQEMIEQIARHFCNLLNEMMGKGDARIAELQMLSREEINKIVFEWNSSPLEYEEKCFQKFFDEQVSEKPDSNALLCKDEALTYKELDLRANSVANHLLQMGVQPEVVVGVGMGRSLDAIACIVGILKAGAAFCVIDPDYPLPRIGEMVSDAGTAIILTRPENEARFSMSGSKIINIKNLLNDNKSADSVSRKVKLENAAYITFTSGSTGKPKGVIATHRSLTVLSNLGRSMYGGKSEEVFCLNSPLGFSSVAHLLMCLCCGFPMVVIPNGQEKDPRVIALAVQQHKITNLSVMPSFLKQLFSLGDEGKMMLSSVERVALSGSEVTWDLIEPFRKMMPGAKLAAGYASSETCVVAFGNAIDLEGKQRSGRVSLGRPNRATQVLVLDQNMNPVPIGIPGELYISSSHLARGYIGQPAMTAEYFLPNPFGRSPGERMYRTGDIVRYRFDGEIEFLGRSDNQVKIRGFRVELEEIEAVLKNHAEIDDAAVVADKNEISDRLIAYIVKKGSAETDMAHLRQYTVQHLPYYMVPSIFIVLNRLPKTANGKIDRQALFSAPGKAVISNKQFESAGDSLQDALIEIWQMSIGVDRIGIRDEFLDLGGDSLIAAIIVMCIRERFDVEIPLSMFFEGLTIEMLAAEIVRSHESNVRQ